MQYWGKVVPTSSPGQARLVTPEATQLERRTASPTAALLQSRPGPFHPFHSVKSADGRTDIAGVGEMNGLRHASSRYWKPSPVYRRTKAKRALNFATGRNQMKRRANLPSDFPGAAHASVRDALARFRPRNKCAREAAR